MIEKIFALLESLSDEQIERLADKHLALGSPEGGIVPFSEALKNLSYNRNLFRSLIEENKLQQFPYTVQSNIHSALSTIQKAIHPIIDTGANNFPALVQHVENLHFFTWKSNLHSITNERVDYESKGNVIKTIEIKLDKLLLDVQSSYADIVEKTKGAAEAEKQTKEGNEQTLKLLENIKTLSLQAKEHHALATNTSAQIEAVSKGVQQTEALVKKSQADATTGLSEIDSLKTKITAFHADIELHKKAMEEAKSISSSTITLNKEETAKALKQHTDDVNKIKVELEKQQKDIDDKLQKATGVTLFHSFGQRKQAVFWGRIFWGAITGVLVGLMVLYNLDLLHSLDNVNVGLNHAFWLRLTLNLPFVFVIAFASLQYSRERMLEEEYAFKSNISLSLEAYRELVDRLIRDEKEAATNSTVQQARERLTTFIISAIDNIYSSPTVRVFGDKKKEAKLTVATKELKEILQTIEPFFKAKGD